MPITFNCACGKKLKVADKFAGKKGKCPSCGAKILIPQSSPPEPAPLPDLESGGRLQLEDLTADQTLGMKPLGEPVEVPAEAPPLALAADKPADEVGVADAYAVESHEAEAAEAAIPVEAPPGADEPATGNGVRCPKCGVFAESGAKMCVQCGAKLDSGEAKETPPTPAKAGKGKTVLIILGAAGLVLLLILAGGGFLLYRFIQRKGKDVRAGAERMVQQQPPDAQSGPGASEPPPTPEPKREAKIPAPKGEAWPGFADESLRSRDRMVAVAAAMTAYVKRTGNLPAALNDLGLEADTTAGIKLLGPETLAVNRFRPLAYTVPPHNADRVYVLFSDYTVRVMAQQELSRCAPSTTAGGLNGAEAALLQQLAPVVKVNNVRFASLAITLDGKPVGTIALGKAKEVPVKPGKHTISLSTGAGSTGKVSFSVTPCMIYYITLPKRQDLPIVPAKFYRRIFSATNPEEEIYTIEKQDNTIRSLKSSFETITFSSGDGRKDIPRDYLSLAGVIKREGHTLRGIGKAPLGISSISRMNAGVLQHDSGLQVSYRETPLGAMAIAGRMNTALLEYARLQGVPAEETQNMSDRFGEMPPMPGQEGPRGRGGRPNETPTAQAPVELTVPEMTHKVQADFQVMAGLLRQISGTTTKPLCRQLEFAGKQTLERRDDMGGAWREPDGRERMPAEQPGEDNRHTQKRTPTDPAILRGELTPEAAIPKFLTPADIIALLAIYGNPTAQQALRAATQTQTDSQSHWSQRSSASGGEVLLAMARCGGAAALAEISAGAQNHPVVVALAFTVISDSAARASLRDMLADWTAADFRKAAEIWPGMVGPQARGFFVRTAATAQPDALDDLITLNALLQIEPHVTAQLTLTRFLAATQPKEPVPVDNKDKPERTDDRRGPRDMPDMPREMRDPMLGMHGEQRGMAARLQKVTPVKAPPSWLLLCRLKNTQAIQRMLELLTGTDKQAKRQALCALAETADDSLVGPVIGALGDQDAGVRVDAARLLAGLKDPKGVQAVTTVMRTDMADPSIARVVVAIAPALGTEAPSQLLAKMLSVSLAAEKAVPKAKEDDPKNKRRSAPPPPVRSQRGKQVEEEKQPIPFSAEILEAIEKLSAPNAELLSVVNQACLADNALTRAAACRTRAMLLCATNPQAALPRTLVLDALSDKDPIARCAGVRLLAWPGAKQIIPQAVAVLEKEKAPEVWRAVMEVMATADIKGLPRSFVITGLRSPDPAVVAAAAGVVFKYKGPETAQAITAALNRPPGEKEQRAAAVTALIKAVGELKMTSASGALQLLADDKEASVRVAVAQAIGQLQNDALTNTLAKLLTDKDAAVSSTALVALCGMKSLRANQAALEKLADTNLSDEIRKPLVQRLLFLAGSNNAVQGLVLTGPELKPEQLSLIAELSATAKGEARTGCRIVAQRYIKSEGVAKTDSKSAAKQQSTQRGTGRGDSRSQDSARRSAAFMLANLTGDTTAETLLLKAIIEDARDIGEPVTLMLKRIKVADKRRLEELQDLYKALTQCLDETGAERYPGLAAATSEENELLCQGILEAINHSTVDNETAFRTLRRIWAYEKRPTTNRLIFASFVKNPTAERVTYVADLYLNDESRRLAPYLAGMAEALGRAGHLNRAKAEQALQRMVKSARTPYLAAALASDALDEIAARK